MIFDTHAHYDDEAFDEDREELLWKMKEQGVEFIVNVGASIASTKKTIELVQRYPFLYGAVGIHPSETEELKEEDMLWLKKASVQKDIVAIGEIGLDYYWPEPDREIQKKWFIRQLALASEVKLPVIIHSRDAAEDTLEILKEWDKDKTGGVIHCFSYSKEIAREYLSMGYYFGIGGVLTFKNARKLVEAVEIIPMEKILLETDCPYLAPEPYRGKRNQSGYIDFVAEKLAKLKGITKEEVLRITSDNAKNFYHLK
ncbi:MAG: TatD family hydrolase [Lachnospiraceae bacterium]|nr:TatD family hydrolase [Lachnospiraceae bacterium]MDY5868791.1 TatD family hydrolase [Lachnospiraceae bacterium]